MKRLCAIGVKTSGYGFLSDASCTISFTMPTIVIYDRRHREGDGAGGVGQEAVSAGLHSDGAEALHRELWVAARTHVGRTGAAPGNHSRRGAEARPAAAGAQVLFDGARYGRADRPAKIHAGTPRLLRWARRRARDHRPLQRARLSGGRADA